MKQVNVGICGLGTVGAGTFNVIQRNLDEIARRAGRSVKITHIGARRDNPACDTSQVKVSRDIFDVVKDPDVHIIVETIGGTTVAKDLVLTAIENGKDVVTANKALIAVHGNEIFAAAEAKGVVVAYEASVAGGIPIIKAIREGLVANQIESLAGIINGTGNFILSEMSEKGRAFEDVLKEAQELGYAEADPTFDVEGIDAAHKLAILAANAFGVSLQFDKVYTEGITKITREDVQFAEELGYNIKHLGIARRTDEGLEMRVHPTLIPNKRLLANVDGVLNAVLVIGDAVGPTMYHGAGAGAEATASAVIADIVDIARDIDSPGLVPHLGFSTVTKDLPVLAPDDFTTSYYLHISVKDEVGQMARIADTLSKHGINMEAIIQKEAPDDAELVPLVLLTQPVKERQMNSAIAAIEALASVPEKVVRIRVERLDS
ncbi:homoserine dehydrogenase [Reinekea marina]|uniref:Homoserine dehydrogenase n=1 Tax=Reinekea marina TaxID=1310421 RepID=A0ABV7WMS5_9GAMM|nr:homoserine dehydrogenase [Reinekea marina]MBU2862322.1 homoserine dehydrogenase [Reinekea forsetii]MDN3649863.1 homoserine dehydrogenase [Reinekea marina]